MTNPGPWTPTNTPARTKPSFAILDTVLLVVIALALGLVGFAILFILIDGGDPDAFVAVVGGVAIAIMAALGRVVIHIARTLDRIATPNV